MAEKVIFSGSTHEIWIKTGVTDIDVQIDLYSAWKEWVIGEPNWAAAFRTFGGDPTSAAQFAPRYFFLINNWIVRAKDVSVSIQTNLYSDDYDSPFIVENAAVTNRTSDVPVVKSELEQRLDYGDRIYYDETSPYTGIIYPVGTIAQPVNNMIDGIALGNLYNIRDFYCLSDITVQGVTGFTLQNYSLFADREDLTVAITGNTFVNTDWHGFTIDMNFGGGSGNLLNKCTIVNALDISGSMRGCQMDGLVRIYNTLVMSNCYSGIPGSGAPVYDMRAGATTYFSNRAYSGGVDLRYADTSGCTSTIELIAGQIIMNSSCTDGYVDLRGVGYITDNSSSGCTVETKGFIDNFEQYMEETREIDEQLAYSNRLYVDQLSGVTGTTYPVGTQPYPVDNVLNLFQLSNLTTIKNIYAVTELRLINLPFVADNFNAYSDTPKIPLYVDYVSGSKLFNVSLHGFDIIDADLAGNEHQFDRCILRHVHGLAGHLVECDLDGGNDPIDPFYLSGGTYIEVYGNTTFAFCHPRHAGDPPKIRLTNPSGTTCAFRDWSGDLIIESMLHDEDVIIIDMSAGSVTINSGCVSGFLDIRGVGYVEDNSGSGCTIKRDGQLQASPGEYDAEIVIDIVNGIEGTIYPVGTNSIPVNNLDDALTLLNTYQLSKIRIIGSLNIDNGEDVSGIAFTAERSTGNYLFITDAITNGTYIENLTCDIVQSGTCRYTTSVLINVENFDGGAKDCLIIDKNIEIVGSGSNYFTNCDRYIIDNTSTDFDIGDKKLNLIRCRGAYTISNKTSTNATTIHLVAGNLTVNSSCTSGVIGIGGICEVYDNSSSGCTVVNRALSNPSIADATWDEQLSEHLQAGSTGDALYNVSAGATPEVIAQAVWNAQLSGFTDPGSAGYSLQFLFDVASGTTSGITQEISDDVKRILGLTQENFLIKDHVYDAEDLLQSATIRIFTSASDTSSDTNPLAEYSMTALYDGSGRLTNYKVIKV